MEFALIIPTWNAAPHWHALEEGIRRQSVLPDKVIIIDSSSTDDTVARAKNAGFLVVEIPHDEFTHGGSRQTAALCAPTADLLIYLTQDAVPLGTEAFRHIVSAFRDHAIGAAFGRQLPRPGASVIEAHARLFNYPPVSQLRSWHSRAQLGFKSIFFSNTFGAYRRQALMSIGGFSPEADFGEDTLAVAHLHLAGWKTAYVAEALVQHSHSYSIGAEFRRYIQVGTLHRRERWLVEQFGAVGGEGWRFVVSELRYVSKHAPLQLPAALLRTAMRYVAYQVGLRRSPDLTRPRQQLNKSLPVPGRTPEKFWN